MRSCDASFLFSSSLFWLPESGGGALGRQTSLVTQTSAL